MTAGCDAHPRGRLGACRRSAARAELAARARATRTPWSPGLWSTTSSQGRRRPGGRRGLAPRAGRRRQHPGVRARRGRLPRPRPGVPRGVRLGYDVFYAGKAFLCTTVARWVAEEGLCLDVCSDGELTVALRAGFDPARIGYHGNTKTEPELRRAVAEGVGRVIVDSFDEIERLERVTASLGRTQPVMVRVTAGVEAHTHEYIATAHEDQKFGFSITLRRRPRGRTTGGRRPGPRAARPALPHRQPDLRHLGLRGGRPPGAGAPRAGRLRGRRHDARARPRRRLRDRLHDPGRPVRPRAAGDRDEQDRRARVPRARRPRAAPVDRARPRHRRPGHVHRLHGRHRQAGRARRGRGAHLRQRRRRHERQHPHGPLRRRLLLHPRLARPPTRRRS